jgi:Ca2+-binding EF-hand superfamily protein
MLSEQQLSGNLFVFFREIESIKYLTDLRQAFSTVDHDNNGLVHTKDIPNIFTNLDVNYKSFIVEGDELKRLIDQIDTEGSC